MKRFVLILIAAFILNGLNAAILQPVKWTTKIEMTGETEGAIFFSADIEPGWHLYGMNLPQGGPKSTVISIGSIEGAVLSGELTPSVKPQEGIDEIFNLKLSWWANNVTFIQRFKLEGSKGCRIAGEISFQACNNKTCISPARISFDETIGEAPAASTVAPAADSAKIETTPASKVEINEEMTNEWWARADFSHYSNKVTEHISSMPWWHVFIWGFAGGILALLTPCVWPMIPMTVSFFLKKNKSKAQSIGDALFYGFSIIVIYLVLGLAITFLFGASKLNELSTSALFNLLFFGLLVVFAISFFGGFDLSLPSRWSNAADGKAETTKGIFSISFMAFTLALVSFSCTGPIIGTLLVEAASNGEVAGPAVGLGGFAIALALPFTLFAIFPSWLKSMPKSGGWLNSVKVVLGFLELALSLKFLSVADLAYGWRILDREVFICLWVVIFVLLGMYLIGKLRFSHDSGQDHVSILRFFLALASWSFALYLIPGLWGAPLKGVSAFVPPLYTQDFNMYDQSGLNHYSNFNQGMEKAVKDNKPVLLDFSGYGCVNCRKMEGAVFDTPEVKALIEKEFVMIELMVDDKQKLASPEYVEENGKKIKIETIGDKWSYLQREKFGANVQPYYVVLDNEGQPLTEPYFYDEDVDKFIAWLKNGIENYSKITK